MHDALTTGQGAAFCLPHPELPTGRAMAAVTAAAAVLFRLYERRDEVRVEVRIGDPAGGCRTVAAVVDLGEEQSCSELVERLDTGGADLVVRLGDLPEDPRERWRGSILTHGAATETASRIARHMAVAVEQIASAGGPAGTSPTTIAELDLLTEEDLEQLAGWASPEMAFPEACLHELVARQAEAAPSAVAIEHEERRLTYAELEASTNRLASHLRGLGVGREVLVAVSVPRSPELVVAILAILKAGGAYLPLDPAYPHERLAQMLEDADASLLVTDEATLRSLPPTGCPSVLLDRDAAQISSHSAAPPEPLADLDDLAYVMYTSGSTGRPKGVEVLHRGITSLSEAGTPSLCAQPGRKVLQFHSASFDPSVWEMSLALARGKTLVTASQADLMPGPALVRTIARHQVETIVLPASALGALPHASLPSLKVIFLEGEPPSPPVVARWAEGRQVFNTYGPTEASMWCVGTYIDGRDDPAAIGRPVANAEVHVLDPLMRHVPPGVVGELHIGGVGLARGYRGRPELTGERFMQAPTGRGWRSDGPTRLYRTGDLARHRSDGALELLGRVDDQVKVRGFRIELGEVESAMAAHPGVAQCAAAVQVDERGHRRLVGYVVPRAGDTSIPDLRRHLESKLAPHMVPTAFVQLAELPLAPTGKLDRRGLPPPDGTRPDLERTWRAPADAVEQELADLFSEVLQLGEVGADDGFSALGGDSLLAMLLVAELENRFGRAFGFAELGAEPTPASIAELIRRPVGSP